MSTREIHRGDWQHFLDSFSKIHQGEMATLQIIGEDVGAQEEAHSLPFVGISADEEGSEKGSISIILGTEPDDHLDHRIVDPTRVWLKASGDPATDSLEVETSGGVKTILQLEAIPQIEP